jgi:hypothetical protein
MSASKGPVYPSPAFAFPPPRKPHVRRRRATPQIPAAAEPITCGTAISYGSTNASVPIGDEKRPDVRISVDEDDEQHSED